MGRISEPLRKTRQQTSKIDCRNELLSSGKGNMPFEDAGNSEQPKEQILV